MNPLICVKCTKKLSFFITRIEECEAVVEGKTVNWTAPNAYCPDCDSSLWCKEFEDIYIAEFERVAKGEKAWYETD